MNLFCQPSEIAHALLIKNVVCFANNFNIEAFSDELFFDRNIVIPSHFKNTVRKRKAEFLCGRHTAQQALAQLGYPNRSIPIGENRAPLFPSATLGSITHSDRTAVCMAALRSEVDYLGVDLEPIIVQALVEQIEPLIISSSERLLLEQSELRYDLAFTIAYSAKESVFKALYERVGNYFDFNDVKLIKICPIQHELSFILEKNLSPNLPADTIVSGKFFTDKKQVLTAIYKHCT